MIGDLLHALRSDLETFLRRFNDGTVEIVGLGNPAFIESEDTGRALDADNRIAISVVNLEEEARLKQSARERDERRPAVHLVLYLLFCATSVDYRAALNDLGRVIAFFQSRNRFRYEIRNGELPTEPATLRLDLHTLNFSQINDLWGSLGGKQLPFVIYRASVVRVQSGEIEPQPPIREIEIGMEV